MALWWVISAMCHNGTRLCKYPVLSPSDLSLSIASLTRGPELLVRPMPTPEGKPPPIQHPSFPPDRLQVLMRS
jgi:hypothetical protein